MSGDGDSKKHRTVLSERAIQTFFVHFCIFQRISELCEVTEFANAKQVYLKHFFFFTNIVNGAIQ